MSDVRVEVDDHLDAALSAGDVARALELGRRIAADSRSGLTLDHALRLTALMVATRHPRGEEAVERWRRRFHAERGPRKVEVEIAEAALRGLRDPVCAHFCERVLWEMIGADM